MNAFFCSSALTRGVVGSALLFALLLTGCDDSDLTGGAEESTPSSLPPNVEFRLSFDETTTTYSSVFPSKLVGAIEKGEVSGNVRFMTNFLEAEATRSFTDDGFLQVNRTYTGGHPTMNMPESVHDEFRGHMPFNPNDANPISQFELTREGKMTYYRENGEKVREHVFDPEEFKVDPEKLDSLQNLNERSVSMKERAAMNHRALQNRGQSLRRLDAYRVQYSKKIKDVAKLERAEIVLDLRFKRPVHMTYYRTNGKIDLIETRAYQLASGYPVMTRSVVYQYGKTGGEWTVTSRTETHRENVRAVFNDG